MTKPDRAKPDRRGRIERYVFLFVLLTLAVSVVYLTVAMLHAPAEASAENPNVRVKSDYVLMLAQCILGVCAMFLPTLLRRRLHLIIPSHMLIVYVIFLYCAIYLGEVQRFYYAVPHWDTILHTFSGAMLGALGFSFINFLNQTERIPFNLSPSFVAVFTFCFGITLGVLWEFYEFACDGILQTNMQKFARESGELLTGRAALLDTMKDLIVDALGALFISIVGYVSIRFRKGWIEKMQLRINRHSADRESP